MASTFIPALSVSLSLMLVATSCSDEPAVVAETDETGDRETVDGDTSTTTGVDPTTGGSSTSGADSTSTGDDSSSGGTAGGTETDTEGMSLCLQDEFVGDNECVPCPAGTSNESVDDPMGPDTVCAPVVCDEDEFVQANQCALCGPGETNRLGDDASGPDTDCDGDLCPSNHFVQENACVPCPPGTDNAPGDDASGPDTECDPGLCDENEFVQSNACVPCEVGTENDAGDDASGPDTSCVHTLCGVDELVEGNVCVSCPAGTENEAGDDASGPDTSCVHTLCGAAELVEDNACVSCPAGTENEAGDDATGPNTLCDPTLCPADQFVQSNACEECPPGSENEDGDDVSGLDTACDPVLCGEDEFVEDNACAPCLEGAPNDAGDDASGPDTVCDDVCSIALGVTCDDFAEAYVKASNTDQTDVFGSSVALDGDTLVVGAPGERSNATGIDGDQANNSAQLSGAAYVFRRTGTTWEQQAYLKASNAQGNDRFGWSVAVSGDTVAIGASRERSAATGVNGDEADNSAPNSGAVYVFRRVATAWAQEAYVKASNTDVGDEFGTSVALSDDTLAVGAFGERSSAVGVGGDQADNTAEASGAVYLFHRTGATWGQEAYLKSSNTDPFAWFGSSVALDGDALAVGSPLEDGVGTGVNGDQSLSGATSGSGAVYVFRRTDSIWEQEAYVKASNPGAGDRFGSSVALFADRLAIGAPSEDSNATGVNGDQDNDASTSTGAAYVFERADSVWSQVVYLKASNTGPGDRFGTSVAVSADRVAVGADDEDADAMGVNGDQFNNDLVGSGAVYLFEGVGPAWTQLAYIKASNPDELDDFGRSVALSGNTLTVATISEDGGTTGVNGDETDNSAFDAGAVYVRRIAP